MTRKKNASGKGQTDVLKQTAETDFSTPSKNNGGKPMTNQDIHSKDPVDLRQKAETIVLEEADRTALDSGPLSPEEIQKKLHELRVHQVELELQNEELRTAQRALEENRARYFDLYDLAPVGYLTLSEQGLILEAVERFQQRGVWERLSDADRETLKSETVRLGKMNLAVHGLSGEIDVSGLDIAVPEEVAA